MFKFDFFQEATATTECASNDDVQKEAFIDLSLSSIVAYSPPVQTWVKQALFGADGSAGIHEGLVQLVADGASGTAGGTSLSQITSYLDVKPGVYEGGFKTWECTKDLIRFLACPQHRLEAGSSVLDLGCGPGLAGCAALQQGCNVVFQDLNADVLQASTSAHVHANCPGDDPAGSCVLLAGPWAAQPMFLRQDSVKALLPSWAASGQFDVILSSETLYREAYLSHLLHALLAAMAPHSTAFLATKRFYFGVGGGTRAWIETLSQELGDATMSATPDDHADDTPGASASGTDQEAADVDSSLLYTSPPLQEDSLQRLHAEHLGGRRVLLHRVLAIVDGGSNVRDVLRLSTQPLP